MWLPKWIEKTTHRSAKQMCSVFYFIWLLTHCMYIIHSKAKFIVIEIINPITRNANISNIASPPNSWLEIKVEGNTHIYLTYFLCYLFYIIFYKKTTFFHIIFKFYSINFLLKIYINILILYIIFKTKNKQIDNSIYLFKSLQNGYLSMP